MREGTKTALLIEGRLDEGIVKRAIDAASRAPSDERVRAGLEAAIDFAETDPATARTALGQLRGDHTTLSRLEAFLEGTPEQATMSLGAAIRIALTELDSPAPDLRSRLPELLRWLERGW